MSQAPDINQYDVSFDYGPDLREVPHNPAQMFAYVEALLTHIEAELNKPEDKWEPTQLALSLGQAGIFLRVLKRLDEAQHFLELSLDLIEEHNLGVTPFVVQSLRYADVLRYQSEWDEAEEMFLHALEICRKYKEVQIYIDVALQHLGKLYFDVGDNLRALKHFEEALTLREAKKDSILVASSKLAIDITKKKMEARQNKRK